MESINSLAGQLNSAQRTQTRGSERALSAAMQIEEAARKQDGALRELSGHTDRVRRGVGA
jgi:hypothetical protein